MKIIILICLFFITSCASTQNIKKDVKEKEENTARIIIPEMKFEVTKRKEITAKKFLGKKGEIFAEFIHSNRGNYLLLVTKIQSSILNLENVRVTMEIDSVEDPTAIVFGMESNGVYSGFGPYLKKGTPINIKVEFLDEKEIFEYNFII